MNISDFAVFAGGMLAGLLTVGVIVGDRIRNQRRRTVGRAEQAAPPAQEYPRENQDGTTTIGAEDLCWGMAFEIDQHITYVQKIDGLAPCSACGADTPEYAGDTVSGVYRGHHEIDGVTYELILRDEPTYCPACGAEWEYYLYRCPEHLDADARKIEEHYLGPFAKFIQKAGI